MTVRTGMRVVEVTNDEVRPCGRCFLLGVNDEGCVRWAGRHECAHRRTCCTIKEDTTCRCVAHV